MISGDEYSAMKRHLADCKLLACREPDPLDMWTCFVREMGKNEHTRDHAFLAVGRELLASGFLSDTKRMTKFIHSFE